jgi:cytochrome c biogenesis protein
MVSEASTPKTIPQLYAKLCTLLENVFASVWTMVVLLAFTGVAILLGAWCPQEAAQGQEKIVEQFGPDTAALLVKMGIADIFHSPFFLMLMALLTLNLTVASFKKVFPKLKNLKVPMPTLGASAIEKLPVTMGANLTGKPDEVMPALVEALKKAGYKVTAGGAQNITAEWGKISRLAPSITHVGLLTLMAGVTITSWTGFNGFQPILLNGELDFAKSEHSKLWIGKLPQWKIRVDETRKETYKSGDPKQWYSTLSVIDTNGKVLKTQEISVNNPLSYDNVDIYQSSWGLDHIVVSFNDHDTKLFLRPMGNTYAAFLPLDETAILIFSVRDAKQPVRVFAKTPALEQPRIIAALMENQPVNMGNVKVMIKKTVPITGLQYKCDPGLWVTYTAFGFIILGVMLASIPHRQVWAAVETTPEGMARLRVGGNARKARRIFERSLSRVFQKAISEFDAIPDLATEASTTETVSEATLTATGRGINV